MKAPLTRIACATAALIVSGYAVTALCGPRGVPGLLQKREQIAVLEQRNEELTKDIERARGRIQRLSSDPVEQERIIKERLKLVHPDEKVYMLAEPARK